MRTGTWGAGLLVIALQAAAIAQEPEIVDQPPQSLGTPPAAVYRPYAEQPVPTATQRLMQQRAFHRAQMRQARIDSRKWLGISVARPIASGDFFCRELNPSYSGYGFGSSRSAMGSNPWVR